MNREINNKIKQLEVYQKNTNNNNLVHIINILKNNYSYDSKIINFCKISIRYLKNLNTKGQLDVEEFNLITKNLNDYLEQKQKHKKVESHMLIKNIINKNSIEYIKIQNEILRIKKRKKNYLKKAGLNYKMY